MSNYHSIIKFIAAKKNRTKIDHVMSVAAVVHPLMAVPQVVQIYSTKQVAGLSPFMWTAWLVLGTVFLTYGIAHRLRPYVLMQLLWIGIDVLIIAGIILYR